jgi:hypothetical protein
MARNFLKGTVGDAVNLFMACAALNFRKLMRKLGGFFFSLNSLATVSEIGPLVKIRNTMGKFRFGILTWYNHPISSGPM